MNFNDTVLPSVIDDKIVSFPDRFKIIESLFVKDRYNLTIQQAYKIIHLQKDF